MLAPAARCYAAQNRPERHETGSVERLGIRGRGRACTVLPVPSRTRLSGIPRADFRQCTTWVDVTSQVAIAGFGDASKTVAILVATHLPVPGCSGVY